MDDDIRRRLPSVPRKASEIAQDDVRVSVTGIILDVSDSGIALDDGTGKINISLENRQGLAANQMVRVFGRVIPAEGGIELQGEIVQPMDRLDPELLKKAEILVKGHENI